jgi:tetratricopeptide (TPR) repeat protein
MKKKVCVFLFVILYNFQLQIKAQIDIEQAMTTGRNALCVEDYTTALHYFDQVINAKPYLSEPYYYRAITRYYLNDLKGAEEDCSSCIERNPFITNAYQLRGEIRQQSENFDGAKEDYEHALKEMPNNKFLLVNLGIVNIRRKSYEEAKSYLDKVIRIYPKYEGSYIAMASLYLALNNTAQALTYYNKTVETNKYISPSYSTRGLFYLQTKKYDEAETDFNEAIKINPNITSNFINRGLARYYKSDLRGAMSDYDKAIEMDPDNIPARFNRALLRSRVGDNNRAIEDFDAILKHDSKNHAAHYQRAMLKYSISDTQGALKDLSIIINEYPDNPGALSLYEEIKKQVEKSRKTVPDESIYIRRIEEIKRHRFTVSRKGQNAPIYEGGNNILNTNTDKFDTLLLVDKEEMTDRIEAKSELKNYLWKTIRPSKSIYIPNSPIFTVTEHTAKNYDATYYYGLIKAGVSLGKLGIFAEFDRNYERMHPQNYNTYKFNLDNMMRMVMPHNDIRIQFMGGTIGTSVNGANLSGGGQKQLSKKTKKVLKEVYGRDVDGEKNK